jgi:hypothetical protein
MRPASHSVKGANRLVKVERKAGDGQGGAGTDETTLATYAYDPPSAERIKKVVANCGDLKGTEYYYYNGEQCIEVRNGSEQITREYPCP